MLPRTVGLGFDPVQPFAPRPLDDLQLDLMEKDIVIEQLRTQLKQLRSRIAEMEEEQAVDTAPLEGLLTQLGELKVRCNLRC